MIKRLFPLSFAIIFALALGTAGARGGSIPSGERIVGGSGAHGGTVVEPVYDDMTGAIRYVSTPRGTPDPVKSPPIAAAPFYLPVYPTGSTVGTLVCQDVPQENCPDHGPAVAGAAQAFSAALGFGSVYAGGVIGHDHLMAGPGSGGDFNIAWVPTLVLFKTSAAANEHLITLAQVQAAVGSGQAVAIPLDGTNGTPNLTFHCSVVSAAVYERGAPFVGN